MPSADIRKRHPARHVGYYEPYATSHEALDRDQAFQEEVRNAARTAKRG